MAVASMLRINGDRLNQSINRLAEIGKLPNGAIKRLAFTEEDQIARKTVQQWMVEAGMTVGKDAAGNLIGTYPGHHHTAAIATGSHIDTVPSGGGYDGVLGVLAGIEVVRVLRENNLRLAHPLEVIVFSDEESSMIGAKAMAGTAQMTPEAHHPIAGGTIQECLSVVGGDWEQLATARRTRSQMAAFVELHVEQGGVLETTGKDIGVVQGVVGTHRYKVTITGRANHAGTTPMNMRRDALVAAASVVLAVQDLALSMPSQPVATVGYMNVLPNAVNIVPGFVELTVDLRDLSQSCLEEMTSRLQQQLMAIATATDTQIELAPLLCFEPSPAAPQVLSVIENICQKLQLSYCHLPSRAGHDAAEMGRFTDMGMIFVPSRAGISHSQEEYTSPEQCVQGANVLLHTLLELDRIYS